MLFQLVGGRCFTKKKDLWIETFDPHTKEVIREWCESQKTQYTVWDNSRECRFMLHDVSAVRQYITVFKLKLHLQKLLKECSVGVVGISMFV